MRTLGMGAAMPSITNRYNLRFTTERCWSSRLQQIANRQNILRRYNTRATAVDARPHNSSDDVDYEADDHEEQIEPIDGGDGSQPMEHDNTSTENATDTAPHGTGLTAGSGQRGRTSHRNSNRSPGRSPRRHRSNSRSRSRSRSPYHSRSHSTGRFARRRRNRSPYSSDCHLSRSPERSYRRERSRSRSRSRSPRYSRRSEDLTHQIAAALTRLIAPAQQQQQQQQRQPTWLGAAPKLERYSGKGKETFQQYQAQLEALMRSQTFESEAQRVNFLEIHLSGEPLQLFQETQKDYQQQGKAVTYEGMVAVLLTGPFGKPVTDFSARSCHIEEIKPEYQLNTPDDYFKVRKLLEKEWADAPEPLTNKEKIAILQQCCSPAMREKLLTNGKAKPFNTWAELTAYADQLMRALQQANNSGNHKPASSQGIRARLQPKQHQQQSGSRQPQLGVNQQQFKRRAEHKQQQYTQQQPKRKARDPNRCVACGKLGHRSYDFKDGKPVCANYDPDKANPRRLAQPNFQGGKGNKGKHVHFSTGEEFQSVAAVVQPQEPQAVAVAVSIANPISAALTRSQARQRTGVLIDAALQPAPALQVPTQSGAAPDKRSGSQSADAVCAPTADPAQEGEPESPPYAPVKSTGGAEPAVIRAESPGADLAAEQEALETAAAEVSQQADVADGAQHHTATEQQQAQASTGPTGDAALHAAQDNPFASKFFGSADRMFNPEEFAAVEAALGKKFTVDCFSLDSGDNALVPKFFSPSNSFFKQQLQDGDLCWVNPPFEMIRDTLTYYTACKQEHPGLSAVFCLPEVRAKDPQDWAHLVKGMPQLRVYRKHSQLFLSGKGYLGHKLTSCRCNMVLYYDPPRHPDTAVADQPQQPTARTRTGHSMQTSVTIAGVPAMAILDTGTEHNPSAPDGVYVSARFARIHGLQVKPLAAGSVQPLSAVDGQECAVHGTSRITLKVSRLVSQVQAVVMDMDEKLDCIIGESWLDKHKAVLDYASKAIMLVKRGRPIIVRCSRPKKQQRSEETLGKSVKILTMTQTKRVFRKKVWYCLVMVQQLPDPEGEQVGEKAPQDERVRILVNEYPSVFTDEPPKGGSKLQAEHEAIPLQEGAKPTFRPMFRYSPLEMAEMEKQIKELLEKRYIEPSTSPYGAPVMFVKKPRSDELRLVLDYRMLNAKTIRNKYPLPRIDDMLDALAGAKYFSTIDLRAAYNQIKLQDSDKPKTAFRTPFGHYQWVTLSMGLTNAPAIFQSVVNNIFRPYLNKFVVVYLDDICVFSKTEEEHQKHLRLVLDVLKEHNLTAAWHKCHFFQEELLFVGHIVGANGVRADPAKVQAVEKFPQPTDVHQLRSFLGMTNYFRRYIHKYAEMVAPLNQLLRKDSEYLWGSAQDKAFEAVKQALITAPVLKLPDWHSEKPFEICCDASYNGLAGVLLQDKHPVAYESRSLIPAEKNYSPTELEMLAVVHCIKQWRCYIEGKDVHVYTDHKPNTTFTSNPMLTRRQARWAEELQSYNIQWHYKPGPENKVADALSRYPVKNPVLVATTTAKSAKHHESVRSMAVQSYLLDRIREGYQHDSWFADATNTRQFTQVDGVYKLNNAVVVPDYDNLRTEVINECHDTPYSGHPGRDKTTNLVQRLFWWPNLAADVAKYVKFCPSCQLVKSTNQLPAGLLKPLPVPGEPWQSVSMDFVTDLPQTLSGFDCITVYVDRLTKMVHLAPSKKTDTATEVAESFIKEVFRLHGMPTQLVTDRGSVFTSVFWRECMQQLGTQQAMSSAYHPQTDGNTERVNRVMEDMLRHFVMADHTKWDKLLPLVEFAINNSYHESIQTTPFLLNYGRTPNTPLRSVLASLGQSRRAPGVQQFMTELQEAQQYAKVCLEAAQQRQKAYADRNRQHVTFELGDKVCLSTKNIKLKMVGSPKLLPQFVGPFKVIGKVNEVAYKLELPASLPIHNVFHVSLLKPYHDDGRVKPPPPEMLEGELEYEVEQILGHRERKVSRKVFTEYLVKWKGYGHEHNTWEPDRNCTHCPQKVQEYWDSKAERRAAQVKAVKLIGKKRKKNK